MRVVQGCLVLMLVAGLWLALVAPSDTGMVLAFSDPPRSLRFSLAMSQLSLSWPRPLIIACGAEGNIDECDFTEVDDYTIVAYCHAYGGCDVNPTVQAAWDAAKAHVGDYPSGAVVDNPGGTPPYIQVKPVGGEWVPVGTQVPSSPGITVVVYTTTATTSTGTVTTTILTTVTQTIPASYSLVPAAVGVMQSWGLVLAGIGGGGFGWSLFATGPLRRL